LSGGTSCSIATMKATKLPTELPPRLLCQSAATITIASAHDASTCVIGEPDAAAIADFRLRRRRSLLARSNRVACEACASCRRTLRHASTFSSTT
jgi:hypothetical protein